MQSVIVGGERLIGATKRVEGAALPLVRGHKSSIGGNSTLERGECIGVATSVVEAIPLVQPVSAVVVGRDRREMRACGHPEQRVDKRMHIGIALLAVLRQCAQHSPFDMRRNVRIDLRRRARRLPHVQLAKRHGVLREKGRMASQQFVGNAGQRVLIAARARGPLELFRCHVERGADHIDIFRARILQQYGDAKVGDKGLILDIEENIFGLQVAMHDILLVNIL